MNMVEKEVHLVEAPGVKNLDGAFQWINPPPSKTHLEHIVSSLNSLEKYLTSRGKLPPSFRSFRMDRVNSRLGEHLVGSTHVSKRDWGWVGKHGYIVFVRLEEDYQDFPITAVAVLRTETPIPNEIYVAKKELTKLRSKSFRIRKKLDTGQTPKFRI